MTNLLSVSSERTIAARARIEAGSEELSPQPVGPGGRLIRSEAVWLMSEMPPVLQHRAVVGLWIRKQNGCRRKACRREDTCFYRAGHDNMVAGTGKIEYDITVRWTRVTICARTRWVVMRNVKVTISCCEIKSHFVTVSRAKTLVALYFLLMVRAKSHDLTRLCQWLIGLLSPLSDRYIANRDLVSVLRSQDDELSDDKTREA